MEVLGKFLTFGGILFVLFGLVFAGKLKPLGNLPGDIKIDRPNFKFHFPLATIILLSAALEFAFKLFSN